MAIINTPIQKESRDRYLTYALSVVSGRALPDVRDGLKPVQRRILYAMYNNLNLIPSHSHRKSAAVVGEVLARFHPHGDVPCYEAMVRLAQDFSMRYPLVDGQGNFGSLDGDNAAAYRYTEAKLLPLALEVIGEIHEETVAFRDNFDSTTVEPVVLPSRVPQLLMNGTTGIAVGMATSIPPHNLSELIEGLLALIEDPDISVANLTSYVKAPDFPTGCSILNAKSELTEMYKTGRGSVRMRGEWKVEEEKRGKKNIIITAIPYALDKSQLVEKIAELIINRKVPQFVDIRDESTDVVRVVLELAPNADAEVGMAYLFRHSPLESSFSVNMTALIPDKDGALRPEVLSLKEMLQHFLTFRAEVIDKKLRFEKRTLEERIHILEGFALIFDALDEAIKIVRKSEGRSDAAEKLRKRFKLSEIQSFAIVDMRIYQLSRTNIDEIRAELKLKQSRVEEIEGILKSKKKLTALLKSELSEIAKQFGDKRISKIVRGHVEVELDESQYVVQEDVYAILTVDGWIKRIRQNNELQSTRLREGDSILQAHALSTLDSVIFFTNQGSMFILRVTDFPSSSGYGVPIQKLLKFRDGEAVVASFAMRAKAEDAKQLSMTISNKLDLVEKETVVLVSKKGVGCGLELEGLAAIKRSGKRVMKVRDGDSLQAVCKFRKSVALFTGKSSGVVVATKEIPVRAQAAVGVSLISVRSGDALVAAIPLDGDKELTLTLSNGNEKQINSKTILRGRRGLKGNKVIARGEITRVEVSGG